jgi:hypothetical protein
VLLHFINNFSRIISKISIIRIQKKKILVQTDVVTLSIAGWIAISTFFCLQQVNSLKKMSKIFFHCALKHETVQHVCIKIPIDTLCISVRAKLCIFHYGNLQDIFIFLKIQEKV